jgi:hypothetical protein
MTDSALLLAAFDASNKNDVLDILIAECDERMRGNPPFATWPNTTLDAATLRARLVLAQTEGR